MAGLDILAGNAAGRRAHPRSGLLPRTNKVAGQKIGPSRASSPAADICESPAKNPPLALNSNHPQLSTTPFVASRIQNDKNDFFEHWKDIIKSHKKSSEVMKSH